MYIEINEFNGQSHEITSHKINLYLAWILQKVVSNKRPHVHSMNTSNLQPNMVSLTQQAAHAIFKETGKYVERAMKSRENHKEPAKEK